MGVVTANRELNLSNAALQANQVLLKLGLLLLQGGDVVVQFHILNLLLSEIPLEFIFNSIQLLNKQKKLTYLPRFGATCGFH